MNKAFKVVFNHSTGTFQAVQETAKGQHKTQTSQSNKTKTAKVLKAVLRPLTMAVSVLASAMAVAAPTGGQVTAGQATINQAGSITNINQSSQNAAINWQSFNVGKNETVNFNQPNAQAVTLNRVIGNERSVIDGAMNANGKVFISNANGMLIGKDAKINVGSLVATTANISDDDFMNGRYAFENAKGSIENLGQITVPKGGVVALIAPIVKNSSKITAPEGNVLLASAENFSITLPDNANFKYTLDKGTLQGLVDNGGAILADAGRVVLTAKGVDTVKKSLIKHDGNIEANTVQNKNGVIELLGDLDNSALNVSGSLKAEAKASGDGGFIETSAAQVKIEDSAEVSTLAENGETGTWLIDPNDIIIASGAGIKPDGTPYTKDEISMSGNKISNVSNKSNVHILSTHGKSQGKGDVIIDDEIFWVNSGMNPTHTLKLTAQNDIHINKTIETKGAVKLLLEYGQGTSDGGESDYYLDKKTPLKDRVIKVNLPEGKTFSTKKGSDGEVIEFDVIHKMPKIVKNANGEWESKFTTHNIAFGADMDVSHTKNYEGFAGWELPQVGDYQWGRVAGLGHRINNLTLHSKKNKQDTGLFQKNTDAYSATNDNHLRDIGVVNADIISEGDYSRTGILVGRASRGSIKNNYVAGNVVTSGSHSHAGGLAGESNYLNTIDSSYAISNVSALGDGTNAGGLVGYGINISNSYATGNVSTIGGSAYAGGLAGYGVNISNSYATGNVSTKGYVANAGGLVGEGNNISNSYATGDIYTTGNLVSTGGLMGGGSEIFNSYATGNVSSTGFKSYTGGLVGMGITISNSYANNQIQASGIDSVVGGVVGSYNNRRDLHSDRAANSVFFNQDKNPHLSMIGAFSYDSDKSQINNVSGKTDAELREPTTFKDWDFEKVWYMNQNADGTYSYPMLRAFAQALMVNPTPTQPTAQTTAGVKAPDLSKTYDGKAVNTVDDLKKLNGWKDNFDATGLLTGDSVESIFKAGTLTIDETRGDWKGTKDVKEGGYELYPTGTLKDEYQQKYIIEWNKGTLTINKKPITIVANSYYDGTDTAKIYDKNDKFFGKQIMGFNGIVKGDDVSLKLGTTGTLHSNQAGNTTLKDLGNLALEGTSANNYTINKDGSTWTINKRPIKVTGSREYNGSEWVNGADLNIDKSDIVGKDQILLNVYTGDVKLDGKDAKNGRKVVDASKIYFGGKDGENYEVDKLRSSVDIKPKNISVEVSKEYDGTNEFTKGFKIKGIIDGENPNIHISKATVAGKDNISDDVDYDKFTSISIAMPDKNYKFENGNGNVVVKVLPKTIVVTPKDGQKIRFNQDDYKNLSYTHSQLVGNDKITGYLQPNNPNVGTRKFGLGTLSAGKNYELVLSNDKYVEITPIPLTIQAVDQSYNTAKNVLSGMGAKDNFNRKLFNIVKDKNLKYPDQILYAGGLGLENERDLQFITAPTGKYAITEGDLNFYGNYDIDFIPATYTVYTQYPNPILDRIIRVGDKIIGMPEGIALDTAYPVVDGVVEGVQGAGYWVARSVKDAEGLPTGQAALVIIWGGVAALGEVASAGLTVATLDKASAVVLVVKGFGTYTIKNTQFLTGWTNEQVQQYVKAYQNTVDILNMLRSTKDWYSLIRSDDPQAKAKFFKDLRKRGKSDKEIREAYNYFRSLGANGQNIEVMLNTDNILSTAYDMLSFTQDNFPETLDKIPTFILEKLE